MEALSALGVLVGISAHLVHRLKSVLNAAAWLIFNLKRSDHIADALVSLHWLRVPECIQYKIAVVVCAIEKLMLMLMCRDALCALNHDRPGRLYTRCYSADSCAS